MKITIDIPTGSRFQESQLYFEIIAKKIGEHIAELISLGNMEEIFVAGIYRKIADAIEGNSSSPLDLTSLDGISTVRDGWHEGMDCPKNLSDVESNYRTTTKTLSALQDRIAKFFDECERSEEISKLSKIFGSFVYSEISDQSFNSSVLKFIAFCKKLEIQIPVVHREIERLSHSFNIKLVYDASDFVLRNSNSFHARHVWTAREGATIPVIDFNDIVQSSFPEYSMKSLLNFSILDGRFDQFLKIETAINNVPLDVASYSEKDEISNILASAVIARNQMVDLLAWMESGLRNGLSRIEIEKKISKDYDGLVRLKYKILNNVEFMFDDRIVKRTKRMGRLVFIFSD